MSLVKVMAEASKLRRFLRKRGSKVGLKNITKRKGLRGGMWAKKGVIGAAYNAQAFKMGMASAGKKVKYGRVYGASHALKGQAIGQFAKRYPKTQFGIQAGKVAGIGALGAWILNDDDKKA